jgi:hypothetical protein
MDSFDVETFQELEEEIVKPAAITMQKLLEDEPPGEVDAVFFFGRTFGDDDDQLFAIAAHYMLFGRARHILINGSEGERFDGVKPHEAWAGKTAWIEHFKKFGIRKVLISKPAFHTKDEHEAFLDVAIAHGWRSAMLLTQPTQILRVMLGQVKSCADRSYPMRLYTAYPDRNDWKKPIRGSQGAAELPRWMHAQLDAMRIATYWYKGDIVSPAELLTYPSHREEIV